MKYEFRHVFLLGIVEMLFIGMLATGCKHASDESNYPIQKTRAEAIPADALKMNPCLDLFPPVLHSDEWEEPVQMAGPVNTAGAEDAPVITSDGNTFFFFFTPDVRVPPERQLIDGVSGIWWTKLMSGMWTEPERVVLCADVALDGPMCIEGDTLWFASFREGNYGMDGDIYTAEYRNGQWMNWQNAGELLNGTFNIGEMYISENGDTMVFDRRGTGGHGGYDLWMMQRVYRFWTTPVNIGATVNTAVDESRPFLSSDGNELWFTRQSGMGYTGPALFRSRKINYGWGEAEEIISNFAGDPALDDAGNIYFTHHFYSDSGTMIEADIYMAKKR